MKIHTRRNSAVGYLTLKAMQRAIDKKRHPRRRAFRMAAYVGLGLLSAGLLAGVLAIALRRRAEGLADAVGLESDNEIVGEYVTAPEPAPAT
jgi:hypothetical protein